MRTRELLLFEDSNGWVGSGEFADRSCGTAEVENGQVTCSREWRSFDFPSDTKATVTNISAAINSEMTRFKSSRSVCGSDEMAASCARRS